MIKGNNSIYKVPKTWWVIDKYVFMYVFKGGEYLF